MYDIIYESCPWHTRVALFDEVGRLLTVHHDDELLSFQEGAVVYGRVRKVAASIGGAFVDIGDVADGFLPLARVPDEVAPLTEGQALMVRVTRGKTQDKGPRLSAQVMHKPPQNGKPPQLVVPAPSALSRTLMDAGDTPVRVWVLDGRHRAAVEEIVGTDHLYVLAEHPDVDLLEQLDTQLDALDSGTFALPGGGRISFEMTRALTAIDVDAGSHQPREKGGMAREVNLIAADEIARRCRLLDIGGSIIIDFITMQRKAERDEICEHLKARFDAMDMRKVEILSMSRFGLLELNREKTGETLLRKLRWPVYVAGNVLLQAFRAPPGYDPLYIEASPEVADILRDRLTTQAAVAYLGRAVEIKAIPKS